MRPAWSSLSDIRALALIALLFLPPLAATRADSAPPLTPLAAARSAGASPLNMVAAAGWPYEYNVAARQVGWAVSTAGDVNGDGYSDMIAVGSGPTSTTNTFFLFLGGPSGPSLAAGFPITGLAPGNPTCGAAGDLNGDGYADVAVGVSNIGGGTLIVYYGRPSGLDTGHPWTNTIGVGAGLYAFSVGTAGDVNGDGFDDLIIGTPGYGSQFGLCGGTTDSHGRVDVFYGSATGIPAGPSWSLFGCQFLSAYSYLGNSVSTAGDVNGDGYDDIIVGAPGATAPGEAYVFLGSATGLPIYGGGLGAFGARITISGVSSGGNFGVSVGTAGDVNGDGYSDVIVGANTADYFSLTDCGEACIYRGSATGVDTTLFWSEYGPTAGAQFGYSVGPAGDVNGDGLADVVVGAFDYSSPESVEGFFAVFQSYKTTMISNFWVESNQAGALLGFSVATAGDVNGDGFSDVVVGEPGYSNGQSQEGAIQLYYGTGDKPSTAVNWNLLGDFASPNYAWSVASAGDVNGDGYDDFLIGDPSFSDGAAGNRGRVFLEYGSAIGPNGVWSAVGGAAGDQLGISVASAGDVNGDGFDDIIVGAHQGGVGVGKALIWYGRAGGLLSGQVADSVTATSSATQFGGSVACAGDVNGDGYADVIVGAPTDASTVSGEGSVFVYLGGSGGLSHTVAWSAHGGQQDAHMGQAVAGGGDINGDGYSDIVAGVPDYDKPAGPFFLVDSGRILWALGGPAGLGAIQYVEGSGNLRLGCSIAFAGDVNGDGYSDVVAGALGYQPAITGEGGAFAFAGSSTGLNPSAIWSQAGGEGFSGFGSSVSSAGDIDGDGLSDIVVGAVFMNAGGANDQGKVFVYRGPLTPGAAPAWTAVGGGTFANIGHTVANAGDVNGDGWSDLVFGLPGFNGRQGDARLYLGAGGLGQVRTKFALRSSGGTVVPMLGRPGGSGLYFFGLGRSAAGRTKVRYEWKLDPAVGTPGPSIAGRQAAFTPTGGGGGAFGSLTLLGQNVSGLTPGTSYSWLLRTLSHSVYFPTSPWASMARNGRREWDTRVSNNPAAVGPSSLGGGLMLAQARPNPARERTTVSFALTRQGPARLDVVDLQGRRVRVLADGVFAAGLHEVTWDGRDERGGAAPAGVYFMRLSAEGEHLTNKVALVH